MSVIEIILMWAPMVGVNKNGVQKVWFFILKFMEEISKRMHIANSPLSIRDKNLLLNNCHLFGVEWQLFSHRTLTLEDLDGASKKIFMSQRGVGSNVMKEIEDLCALAGVKWKE